MTTSYEKLIQFAKDTKDLNPNLLADIESGLIKPCKMLDDTMKRFYDENE